MIPGALEALEALGVPGTDPGAEGRGRAGVSRWCAGVSRLPWLSWLLRSGNQGYPGHLRIKWAVLRL